MAHFFPSLKPTISDISWFDPDSSVAVADENDLQKEEEEYNKKLKAEVNKGKDITPIGKKKEKNMNLGEEEDGFDEGEDDSNNGDLEEDTDEFDTASPELDSGDSEMFGVTSVIETDEAW